MLVNQAITGSGKGLLAVQHQAITWTNDNRQLGPEEHNSLI